MLCGSGSSAVRVSLASHLMRFTPRCGCLEPRVVAAHVADIRAKITDLQAMARMLSNAICECALGVPDYGRAVRQQRDETYIRPGPLGVSAHILSDGILFVWSCFSRFFSRNHTNHGKAPHGGHTGTTTCWLDWSVRRLRSELNRRPLPHSGRGLAAQHHRYGATAKSATSTFPRVSGPSNNATTKMSANPICAIIIGMTNPLGIPVAK